MNWQRALQTLALLGIVGGANAATAADLVGEWGTSDVACSGDTDPEASEGFDAISIVKPQPDDDFTTSGICTATNQQDDAGVTRFDMTCSFEGEKTVWTSAYSSDGDAITVIRDGKEPATYKRCR